MMLVPGHPVAPLARLLPSIVTPPAADPGATMILTTGSVAGPDVAPLLADGRRRGNVRVLVVGALGVHPDAESPRLRELWALEEACRASGLPVMVLRLAPLLGGRSPLWLRLRSRPALGRHAGVLLCPLVEADAALAIERAASLDWNSPEWYEVAGNEIWSLEELSDLAGGTGERLPAGTGAWEPALDEIAEARIPDPSPWRDRFALKPASVRQLAASWS